MSGDAVVDDDESTAVGWFALDGLPEMSASQLEIIRLATEPGGPAAYQLED